VTFRIPGLPRVAPEAWSIGTEHFTERFGLFIILALGESIVIDATTSELDVDTARVVALGMAFLATAALWWLYFSAVARIAQRHLELSKNRTVLARDAYTYLHVVIVAGVIVSAVGDELMIAHPMEVLPGSEVAAVVAGQRSTCSPTRSSASGWQAR
jgi:low temperature requirement protein LtrA